MTPSDFAAELGYLAASLEEAIPLCTTRVEHIRVAGHAARARRLADTVSASDTNSLPLQRPSEVRAATS